MTASRDVPPETLTTTVLATRGFSNFESGRAQAAIKDVGLGHFALPNLQDGPSDMQLTQNLLTTGTTYESYLHHHNSAL
jgi:hypothetical protein